MKPAKYLHWELKINQNAKKTKRVNLRWSRSCETPERRSQKLVCHEVKVSLRTNHFLDVYITHVRIRVWSESIDSCSTKWCLCKLVWNLKNRLESTLYSTSIAVMESKEFVRGLILDTSLWILSTSCAIHASYYVRLLKEKIYQY